MRKWQVWIGLAISLLLIGWTFGQISSPEKVWAAVRNTNYYFIVPALLVYTVGVWFRAMRWRLLLAPMKQISATRLFPALVVGYMANNILPARIGELVRAYLLGEREGIDKSATLATIFIERVFDGLALVSLAVVVSFIIPFEASLLLTVRAAALVFGAASLVFLAAAFMPSTANRAVGFFLLVLPSSVRPKIGRFAASFINGMQSLQRGNAIAKMLGLSLLAWLCEASVYYIIGIACNIFQPYHVFALSMAVANIGIMVPSSPGYVGPFEAAMTLMMRWFQVDADLALGYILVLRVVLFVPVTLLGFFFVWRQGLSISKMGKAPATSESGLSS